LTGFAPRTHQRGDIVVDSITSSLDANTAILSPTGMCGIASSVVTGSEIGSKHKTKNYGEHMAAHIVLSTLCVKI